MPRQAKIHWAGGLVYDRADFMTVECGAGYPCCCYGDRARQIAAEGNQTWSVAEVTCGRCLALLRKAGVLPPPTPQHEPSDPNTLH
jgi:hypothetical protein